MCGIAGIIRKGEGNGLEEIKAALHAIAHRGPDDEGVWNTIIHQHDEQFAIALGHVRLAILDLSPKGHQPMVSHDGIVIVFNGEIYNYLELREQLRMLGHRFATDTDTEVILASYQQWGEKCIEHFIGMWAFGLWDGKRLFLSRDRLGKKPLYYYHDTESGLFAFASEIKALNAIAGVRWEPDERTVFRFLAFAEMERNGNTFYKDIREFPAASCLSYTLDTRELRPQSYWTLPAEEVDIDESEAVSKATDLLYDSLRLRLRSDAPLGLSLSGGLDSTLLLALLNELGVENPPTFSSSYTEPGYSESRYIQIASQSLKCQPHTTVSSAPLFCTEFEKLIFHLDQPSKLPGPYSQWRVVDLARQQVKVLIDGQGADELAGGYLYFLPTSWQETPLLKKIQFAPDLLLTLWGNRHMLQQYPLPLMWERIRGKANQVDFPYLQRRWIQAYSSEKPHWERMTQNGLNVALRRAILDTSLPALLRYGDRVTMAFGVENRCPFLDHRLVEFVSTLPPGLKIRGGTTKWVFRSIAKNRVPKAVLKRRMKMGFPTPVGVWLRGKLLETARRWLLEYTSLPSFNHWIDLNKTQLLLEEHASGQHEHQAVLWRVLAFGAWLKTAKLE